MPCHTKTMNDGKRATTTNHNVDPNLQLSWFVSEFSFHNYITTATTTTTTTIATIAMHCATHIHTPIRASWERVLLLDDGRLVEDCPVDVAHHLAGY